MPAFECWRNIEAEIGDRMALCGSRGLKPTPAHADKNANGPQIREPTVGLKDRARDAAQKAEEAAERQRERNEQSRAGATERAALWNAQPPPPPVPSAPHATWAPRTSPQAQPAPWTAATPSQGPPVLFQGTSHEHGRNAVVTLYADRIERVKERSRASMSRAKQDTEVTPVKSISSVQAKKEGFRTNVTVYASGNNIDFRFGHDEAYRFKDTLMQLILQPQAPAVPTAAPPPAPVAPSPPPVADPVDQIRRLGELKDAGLLSEAEFEQKKQDILSRM